MKKILVIDDEKDYCYAVEQHLKGIDDYQIIIALSGEEGIQLARKHKPDLILLDIVMPKMSGLDVLKILKEDDKTVSIPVIILTVKQEDRYEIEARSLYAEDYFVKLDPMEPLKIKIENILSKDNRQ